MKFTPQPMVSWYDVRQLASTGIQSVLSSVFGNYADKRELQAAIKQKKSFRYDDREELWLDYVADNGDGFNSAYSVASLLAQPNLTLNNEVTQRGKILVMGGDQVYPTPDTEEYLNRLQGPYHAAFPLDKSDSDPPHLFAIPGNHDWYDGLSNFIKVFCQGRTLGNWYTQQKRSYFALQLPHGYWLWGIDVQLRADIDQPQKEYFEQVAREEMAEGDKVILCTAEPAWIYKSIRKKDSSYDRLKFFEETYLTGGKGGKTGKRFELVATLSGDLHHYSRYAEEIDGQPINHRITAGGGGAFMHPTHNLPEQLTRLKGENQKLQAVYPDAKTSRKLALRNLFFPYLNSGFALFLGLFHLVFAWILQSTTQYDPGGTFMSRLSHVEHLGNLADLVYQTLSFNPTVVLFGLVLVLGLTAFTDTNTGPLRSTWLAGFVHALTQLTNFFLLFWLFSWFNGELLGLSPTNPLQVVLYTLESVFIGGGIGACLMGVYLWFTNVPLGIHDNEAFSSLRIEDYKCFLRLHITSDGLTIYPIGIPKVTQNWKPRISHEGDILGFEGDEVKYCLIEPPVVVPGSEGVKD